MKDYPHISELLKVSFRILFYKFRSYLFTVGGRKKVAVLIQCSFSEILAVFLIVDQTNLFNQKVFLNSRTGTL